MRFFSRLIWAYRFARQLPRVNEIGWTGSDSAQTNAFLTSSTGIRVLAALQNKVAHNFFEGALKLRPDLSSEGLGVWWAIARMKELSEGEPKLAQTGSAAPAQTQPTKPSSTDDDELDSLHP